MVLSWADKIKTTIGGMEFVCHPPVGEIEMRAMRLADLDLAPRLVAEARRELGTDATDEAVRDLAVKKIAETIASDTELIYKQTAARDELVDLVVCGWSGVDGTKAPEFPTNGKPSSVLPMVVKKKLVDWYDTQFVTTVDEVKN